MPESIGNFDADKFKNEKRRKNKPGIYPLRLTETLRPLTPHAGDITLVTGVDRTYKDGQDVPAQGASCYLTSVAPQQAVEKGMLHPNGRTLDQIIGGHIGGLSVFKTLEVSCNGFTSGKDDIYFDNISWYGPDAIAPSIKDPKKLSDRLLMADSYGSHAADVTDLIPADGDSYLPRTGQDESLLDGGPPNRTTF